MSQPDPPHGTPHRFASVDVLRGVAVLGILAMNVQSFAMPDAAYLDPYAYGDLRGANRLVWLASHVVASGRFITIFSMLFGAGLVLRERADDRDAAAAAARFVRRQLALLAIGVAHAYLLWSGDILVSYALVGLLVFPFRRAPPRTLIAAGAIAFSVGVAIQTAMALTALLLPPGERAATIASFAETPASIAAELAAYRGPWPQQQAFRAAQTTSALAYVLPFYSLPCTGGLMAIGVGVARLGFFQGAWRAGAYRATIAVGLGVGLSLTALELWLDARFAHVTFWTAAVFARVNDVAALFAAFAYAAIVALAVRGPPGVVGRSLANVGRAALSCYLGQTLICTTLFYGHGLGWFGHVDRVGQLGVVACVWIVELVAATLWLRAFRLGPAEWLWRSATYARWQPMRRSADAAAFSRTITRTTSSRSRSTRGS